MANHPACAEFTEVSVVEWAGMYCADFKLSERIEDAEIYLFIFGSRANGGSILIDLGERELSSFFNFAWDTNGHPPFLKDFTNGKGLLKSNSEVQGNDVESIEEKDIFSFEEFKDYLKSHRGQGRLNVVVVE
ncbi:MAG: hypothetical protein GXY14_10205 [Spirochaetes bacterium]|nr:hypothetical protein [Spirochaetota bacterium]